jgi:hypothetical protein
MTNQLFRDRLVNSIRHAISEAQNASKVEHSGVRGRIREIAASSIFLPMLPGGFEIGTGKICDRHGQQSPETDLIIYNRAILPPVLYSERDGLFPIEASFYAVEIKSVITATEVRDAIRKGKAILDLDYEMPLGPDSVTGKALVNKPVLLSLFGFDSDLAQSGMTEIQRYANYDPLWNTDPVLRVICVIGRGYWYFKRDRAGWVFHPATELHDEVIDFVGNIGNSLTRKVSAREREGQPLGQYLMRERPVQTFR